MRLNKGFSKASGLLVTATLWVTPLLNPSRSLAADTRIEHDSIGDLEIPNNEYYGVQTSRALENFPFDTQTLQHFPNFIIAYANVKKAAALANNELGALPKDKMDAIIAACDEVISGKFQDQFVEDMIQGGAGTSTNMNVNEVIANMVWRSWDTQRVNISFCTPMMMSICPNPLMTAIRPLPNLRS